MTALKIKRVLLTRDQFREGVFARDNHKCVICGAPAVDAHHIVERKLFDDGGYYLDNGASLCAEHHLQAEDTSLSVEDIREAAGITHPVIPPGYSDKDVIDKWGNVFLPNGLRMKGPLFDDDGFQALVKREGLHQQFTELVRYPSTPHLPWSGNVTSGTTKRDRILMDADHFEGAEVVVTEKMDGENTTIYHGSYTHARSPSGGNHPSRDWVKALSGRIGWEIPHGWRLCGENMYAKHSIGYEDLESYFLLFSIWTEENRCLSWDDTLEWAELVGVKTVPELYRGPWDEKVMRELAEAVDVQSSEGYVVRFVDSYSYYEFPRRVAKWVRKNHVNTDQHWARGPVIPNGLKS